jgi:hypothetical protein
MFTTFIYHLSGATGFLVPSLIGAITNNNMTFSAWKLVFGLAATIYFAGNMVLITDSYESCRVFQDFRLNMGKKVRRSYF